MIKQLMGSLWEGKGIIITLKKQTWSSEQIKVENSEGEKPLQKKRFLFKQEISFKAFECADWKLNSLQTLAFAR